MTEIIENQPMSEEEIKAILDNAASQAQQAAGVTEESKEPTEPTFTFNQKTAAELKLECIRLSKGDIPRETTHKAAAEELYNWVTQDLDNKA